MYIVDVIPIAKGITREALSYFSASEIEVGCIVKIPVKSGQLAGIVTSVKKAEDSKASLKASAFQIKKISKVGKKLFSTEFIESASVLARFFASSSGAIIDSLTPKNILESADTLEGPTQKTAPESATKTESHETLVIQAEDKERLAHYKSLIREEFAKKRSVLFILPTIHDITRASHTLSKGIEDYTHLFHGGLSKKEILQTWKNIASASHPILGIGTGMTLSLPRADIGLIIVEKEHSSVFKQQTRPYLDIRKAGEVCATTFGARIVFGDTLLRIETLWRQKNNEIHELAPLKFRSLSPSTQTIVDMRQYKTEEGKKFKIISDELDSVIKNLKTNNEQLFIFAARKGLSPTTVCADCGKVVMCKQCKAPVVLHKGNKGNVFLCHRCGDKRTAEEVCENCGSWRLVTLGIGIDRVVDEIQKTYKDLNVYVLDKERAPTMKKALSIVESFYASPGSLLVGSELAIPYLETSIANTAIISLDSLFSIPDFRIHEKIMALIMAVRGVAEHRFVLQTRNIGEKVLEHATSGNLIDFYREEIELRKTFNYPPFSTFIKISRTGERSVVAKDMEYLATLCAGYDIFSFPAFIEIEKGKYVMNALIKMKDGAWVDEKLLNILRSLPPYFNIKVDPESIL